MKSIFEIIMTSRVCKQWEERYVNWRYLEHFLIFKMNYK